MECAAGNCEAPSATSGAVAAQPLADFAFGQVASRMVDKSLEPDIKIGACECVFARMTGHNDHSNVLERLQC